MTLGEYVRSLPRGERQAFRERLAAAHSCSVSLVRKWENWPPPSDWSAEKVSRMSRRHPAEIVALRITEELTGHSVGRKQLRPEFWSDDSEEEAGAGTGR